MRWLLRIGYDDVAGLREGLLDFGGDGGVHGGEEELRRVAGLRFFHRQAGCTISRSRRRPDATWRLPCSACRRSVRWRPAT